MDPKQFQVLTPGFDRLRISGGLRLDYLADTTVEPRVGTVRYQSSGISTNKDGEVVSVSDGALRVQYGNGRTVIETDRERLIDVGADSTSDTDGNLRNGSLDFAWAGWPMSGGIPQAGARVDITGADRSSATISVAELTPDEIVYRVTIVDADGSQEFDVRIPR